MFIFIKYNIQLSMIAKLIKINNNRDINTTDIKILVKLGTQKC